MSKPLWWRLLIPGCFCCILSTAPAQAQLNLTPDNTAGTQVETTGNRDRIVGGTQPQNGTNLFHSFSEFNVREGRSVIFAAPNGVRNIFSRVTGADPSDILGTLGTEGGASLFLMNPNGILFGPNARLDVGGSFVGTTANAIQFGTQGFFTATPDAPSPLLTVSPSALFFNQFNLANPIASRATLRVPDGQTLALLGGTVTLDASNLSALGGHIDLGAIATGSVGLSSNLGGNLLTFNVPGITTRSDVVIGNGSRLNVNAGNGGSLAINANNLTVLGGSRLTAGIAADQGSAVSRARDITLDATGTLRLTEQSRIINEVAGGGVGAGGAIRVDANALLVTGGAKFNVATFGRGDAGDIVINVRDRLSFDGFIPNAAQTDGDASGLSSYVDFNAQGRGGNILITAGSVSVTRAASIASFSFGNGNAGNIQIRANGLVSFDGATPATGGRSSNAISFTFNHPNNKGGNIDISGDAIELNNGAEILAFAFNGGNAGQISLNGRDRVVVNGVSASRQAPSAVRSRLIGGTGSSGNISLSAPAIAVSTGGEVSTSTSGQGDAGNILLNGGDRVVVGGSSAIRNQAGRLMQIFRSEVKSGVESGAVGQGGDIRIATGSLAVQTGARLSVATQGRGNGGNVLVEARDRVAVEGIVTTGDPGDFAIRSEIRSGVLGGSVGQGGDIRISTGTLSAQGGGRLDASVEGQGNGGDIVVKARDRITLDGFSAPIGNNGVFNASGISSVVGTTGQGRGGNIQMIADTISLTNSAAVLVGSQGIGDGGDAILSARSLSLDGASEAGSSVVTASLFPGGRGSGGSIQIQTADLSLTRGAQLFANTFGRGNAGNISVDADRVVLDGTSLGGVFSGILASAIGIAEGQGGDVRLNVKDSLTVTRGARITADTQATGNAGSIFVNANRVVLDGASSAGRASSILANVAANARGQGGDVRLNVKDSLTVAHGANISVDTQGIGNAGDIAIDAGNGDVLLSGRSGSSVSGLLAGTGSTSQGQGGNITIRANNFRIEDGAAVNTVTRNNNPGGRVTIAANTLSATQGGQILTTTTSSGGAGNISLNVRGQTLLVGGATANNLTPSTDLTLSNEGTSPDRFASGLFANTLPNSTGRGGNVELTTGQLVLRQGAQITAASRGTGNSGNLTIRTPQITLNEAQILAETSSSRGGNITLQNLDRLQLDNHSTISASTETGEAGNLVITTERGLVQLRDGSQLSVAAKGGRAGNLTINADQINLQGSEVRVSSTGSGTAGGLTAVARNIFLNGNSSFNARTEAGQGADISLSVTNALRLRGNSSISASTQDGRGGTFNLNSGGELANLVELIDRSSLSAEATGRGSAGSVGIHARQLRLRNQAEVAVSSANGAAGELAVTANDVFLDQGSALNAETIRGGSALREANIRLQIADTLRLRDDSRISASTQEGTGGTLSLNSSKNPTSQVILSNGSRLVAEATSTGNAGSVEINASQIRLRGNSRLSTKATGTGNAGRVEINADQVSLQDGAEISAATQSGQGGGIRIRGLAVMPNSQMPNSQGAVSTTRSPQSSTMFQRVSTVEMNGNSNISASTRSGRGGNITLRDVDRLWLDNSNISASASTAQGIAGSLRINGAGTVNLGAASSLSVDAKNGGTAGGLTLTARQITARDRSDITVSSLQGQAGILRIAATEGLNLSRGSGLSANTGANDSQNSKQSTGSIQINAPLVLMSDGSNIETNADRTAQGGNITLDTQFLVAQGDSDITANASGGSGGKITINAQSVLGTEIRQQRTPNSDITAISDLDPTLNGQVQLNTLAIDPSQGLIELPTDVVDRSQQTVQRCSATAQSSSQFVITGRGGLPPSPTDPRSSDQVFYGWASLMPDAATSISGHSEPGDRASNSAPPTSAPPTSAPSTSAPAITEAQGWITNAQGKLVLVAAPTTLPQNVMPHSMAIASPQCH